MSKQKVIRKWKVAGTVLECPICNNDEFWIRETLMNTVGLTFFNLDWANKKATNYICGHCGHVLWFL